MHRPLGEHGYVCQQNTFAGKLTQPMLQDVLRAAGAAAGLTGSTGVGADPTAGRRLGFRPHSYRIG